MRTLLLTTLLAAGLLSACNRPTAPSDTDQQQGNPQAQPEKGAKSTDNKQPGDNEAGRNAHTGRPDGAKRQ